MKKLTDLAESYAEKRAQGMSPTAAYREATTFVNNGRYENTLLTHPDLTPDERASLIKKQEVSAAKNLERDPMVQQRIATLTNTLAEWRYHAAHNMIAQTEDVQAWLTGIVANVPDESYVPSDNIDQPLADTQHANYTLQDRLKAADMLLKTHGAYHQTLDATLSVESKLTYEERRSALLSIIHTQPAAQTPALPDNASPDFTEPTKDTYDGT